MPWVLYLTLMKVFYAPYCLKMIPEDTALDFTRQEANNMLKATDLMEFLKLDVESRERTENLTQKRGYPPEE